MQGLPANGNAETVYLYAVVLVIFGCLKSWVSWSCLFLNKRQCCHCLTCRSRCLCGAFGAPECGQLMLQAGPCCNNPIFAEIVPPSMRNMVYAFDRYPCSCLRVSDSGKYLDWLYRRA